MSPAYVRMLSMLALIDKEPAIYRRKDLADRYGISISRVSGTLKAAKLEFDVEVAVVGYGKDKRYKLIDWGGFKGDWVVANHEKHESILRK